MLNGRGNRGVSYAQLAELVEICDRNEEAMLDTEVRRATEVVTELADAIELRRLVAEVERKSAR